MAESDRPLQAFLDGSLKPHLALISDNIVQPAFPLLHEIVKRALSRAQSVCLLCTETLPANLLADLSDQEVNADLTIIDACDEEANGTTSKQSWQQNRRAIDVEDLASIDKVLADCQEKTTLIIDSLNTLEAFNSPAAVYRLLKKCIARGIDIVAVHHTDAPSAPSASTSVQLLPSLLSPTFSSSLLHLTLHSPAVLAHLHHAYSIENVGQDATRDIDSRVYEYLPLLHNRHWASPLQADGSHTGSAQDTTPSEKDTAQDSSDPRDVVLYGLSDQSHSSGTAGRCCVEYSMRGLGKANKRSEAAKMVKGLQGLQIQKARQPGQPAVLSVTKHVSQVLRIRSRTVAAGREVQTAEQKPDMDPTTLSTFNLGITDKQREARDSAGLPYTPKDGGEIVYQPDSADDLDESDPDEDLDL